MSKPLRLLDSHEDLCLNLSKTPLGIKVVKDFLGELFVIAFRHLAGIVIVSNIAGAEPPSQSLIQVRILQRSTDHHEGAVVSRFCGGATLFCIFIICVVFFFLFL